MVIVGLASRDVQRTGVRERHEDSNKRRRLFDVPMPGTTSAVLVRYHVHIHRQGPFSASVGVATEGVSEGPQSPVRGCIDGARGARRCS